MTEPAPAPLQIALVGYGAAGRGIHARLLRAAGGRVTHVVVRDRGRAAAAAEDWPGVVVLADLDALVAVLRPTGAAPAAVDAVVLASPSALHSEQAITLLEAGLPVVTDKPLAVSEDEGRRVLDVAARTGTPLTVFQNRRWDPEHRALRTLIADGTLGTVHRFERRWERWRPVPLDRWKENDLVGGGLLLDLGSHLVDGAIDLFGPVRTVYAELAARSVPTVDDLFLSLHHHSGTRSHLSAGSLVGAPGPRTRALGSKGAYLVTSYEGEPTPFALLDDAVGPHEGWLVQGGKMRPVAQPPGGHGDFYPAVARWLRGAGPVPVDPADAVRTARVLDAAVRSGLAREVVDVD